MTNKSISTLMETMTGSFEFYDKDGYDITTVENDEYNKVSMLDSYEIIKTESESTPDGNIIRVYVNISMDNYRTCDDCGCVFDCGYTDEYGHLCEDCFEKMVSEEELTETPDGECGENGGYWLDTDGNDTGWFYTEWY